MKFKIATVNERIPYPGRKAVTVLRVTRNNLSARDIYIGDAIVRVNNQVFYCTELYCDILYGTV